MPGLFSLSDCLRHTCVTDGRTFHTDLPGRWISHTHGFAVRRAFSRRTKNPQGQMLSSLLVNGDGRTEFQTHNCWKPPGHPGSGDLCWRASDRGGGCQKRRGSRYLSGRSPLGVAVQSGQSPAANRAVHMFRTWQAVPPCLARDYDLSSEGAPLLKFGTPPTPPSLGQAVRVFGPELGPYFMGTFAWATPPPLFKADTLP